MFDGSAREHAVRTVNDPNVVDTSSGQIRGYELFGARVFRGIPYAQASRFAAPTRPEGWGGTLDVTTYGPTAPAAGRTANTGIGCARCAAWLAAERVAVREVLPGRQRLDARRAARSVAPRVPLHPRGPVRSRLGVMAHV